MFAAVPYQTRHRIKYQEKRVHIKLNFSLLKPHLLCGLGVLFEIINQVGVEVQM